MRILRRVLLLGFMLHSGITLQAAESSNPTVNPIPTQREARDTAIGLEVFNGMAPGSISNKANPIIGFSANFNVNINIAGKSDAEVAADEERRKEEKEIKQQASNKKREHLNRENKDLSPEEEDEICDQAGIDAVKKHRKLYEPAASDIGKTAVVAAGIIIPVLVVGGIAYVVYDRHLDKENELSNDLDERCNNIRQQAFQNAKILVDGYRESGILDGMPEEEARAWIRQAFEEENAEANRRCEDLRERYRAARNGPCTIM